MKENLKTFIENNKDNLKDNAKKDFFKWQICIEYGLQYQRYVKNEMNITKEMVNEDRKLVLQYIPEKVIEYIELYVDLDKEYRELDIKINGNLPVHAPKKPVKDTNWRGFWMKATGNDFSLFIGWLKSGIKYDKYKTRTLVEWYMQEWRKKSGEVPDCVKAADTVFQAYFNK